MTRTRTAANAAMVVLALGSCGCPPAPGGDGAGGEQAEGEDAEEPSDEGAPASGVPEDAETYCLFTIDGDGFEAEQVTLEFKGVRMDDAYWLYSEKGKFTRLGFTGKWKNWKVGLGFKVAGTGLGTHEVPLEDDGYNIGWDLTFYDRDVPAGERPRYYTTQGTVEFKVQEGDYLEGTFTSGLVSRRGDESLLNTPQEDWIRAQLTQGRFRAKFDERMRGAHWPAGE